MNKNLVIYFTHRGETYFPDGYKVLKVGNSERIANKVAKIIPADIFEIKTSKAYPVSYKECCDEAKREQERGELPKLKDLPKDIEKYENVILVYPCWWGTMPQAMFSLLHEFNLDGVGIFPICTHEGSGLGRSVRDLELYEPNAIIYDGLSIYGHDVDTCDDDLKEYLLEYINVVK